MKKWGYSILFFTFSMEAYAQSSWLDSAKNMAAKTWETAQRVFIYDDRPVQSFAEPLRQQIRQRVTEENQRSSRANEAAIQNRLEGFSCDALKISDRLETDFINKCRISEIQDNCNIAVTTTQAFSSDETMLQSNVQDRVTLQQLKAFHKGMIKNLNSIVRARENCYTFLSRPLVDGQSGSCKQSLETTLNKLADQVAAVCTEEDFNRQINAFIDKMRTSEGAAHQIYVAKEQYVRVRQTELQMAHLLLSLTETIQSRLTHERATASVEITEEQKKQEGK